MFLKSFQAYQPFELRIVWLIHFLWSSRACPGSIFICFILGHMDYGCLKDGILFMMSQHATHLVERREIHIRSYVRRPMIALKAQSFVPCQPLGCKSFTTICHRLHPPLRIPPFYSTRRHPLATHLLLDIVPPSID